MRRAFRFIGLVILIVACLPAAAARAELRPDELVLIVNGNVPASVKLAEFYAKARLVPDGRILKIDLPGGEELPFDAYEQKVVPAVREFLRANHLQSKVKCLVMFYGVPFRVGSKATSPQEADEVVDIKQKLDAALQQARPAVADAEGLAQQLDPSFVPRRGDALDKLADRVNAALASINKHLPPAESPLHKEVLPRLLKLMISFGGDAQIAAKLSDADVAQVLPPEQAADWPKRRAQIQGYTKEVAALEEKRWDAQSRKRLREVTRDGFGLFGHANLLQAQLEYMQSDGTVSALDSELALLWWNYYNRSRWQVNPLNYRFRGQHPPVLMTCRLDGPQEGTAMQIVLGSLKAEREGLKGRVVIDSTNGTGPGGTADRQGGYRQFDDKLLAFAEIVRQKTNFVLTVERTPRLLPPKSLRNVALYTGWYSVRNYIPACEFNPGAVGFHVASFEMVSLRGDNEKGWVAGLLNDGIAATVGAVAEPYLSAFPAPEEFFPLLMTGKLTLAEVYWKTVPMTSWMMCCVGDPLYTPFKVNPLLKPQDLPDGLRAALDAPPTTTAPAAAIVAPQ